MFVDPRLGFFVGREEEATPSSATLSMLRFIRTAFWVPFGRITFHSIFFHTPPVGIKMVITKPFRHVDTGGEQAGLGGCSARCNRSSPLRGHRIGNSLVSL